MTIDAHQHFWNYNIENHTWIDDTMSVIRKDFMPADLMSVYQDNSVDGCVAVQADQSLKETDFLLKLAEQNDFIKGVVGWVDLQSEHIDKQLQTYKNHNKLKGTRHIVQGETDPNFLSRPAFLKGISQLEKYNYTYDILVFPNQLLSVLEFVKKFPNQKFVIDHMAKPHIKDGLYDDWADLMTQIAKQANVYCKLSGMVTEADYKQWTPKQIEPYMTLILEAFGSKRILYGSDWPVCLVAANYKEVKNLVINFISNLSQNEQADIMGKNAVNFYNL